jgi:16S rRNA (cytosine967-C5)-methyltransferase
MQLPALIGHSARLFRLIWKSPQPSDTLSSQFFREKKYIGSKERRFISETVFAALRMKLLAEHCALRAIEMSGITLPAEGNKNKNESQPEAVIETYIIAATCLIAIFYPSDEIIFSPEELIENVIRFEEINFEQILAEALCFNLGITTEKAELWMANLVKVFNELNHQAANVLESGTSNPEKLRILQYRCSVPFWIMESWLRSNRSLSWNDICSLGESLLRGADVCLRVNLNVMSRRQVMNELEKDGIQSRESALSPAGIVLKKRVQLSQNELFKSGAFEVQDEGSQLISYALAPEEGSRVLDACAGAGGKTLHIASITRDKAFITASDIERMRLKEVHFRAARAGYKSIKTVLINPKEKKLPFRQEFDYVLVDAPCSGMGTTRRMPMPKWRLTPQLIKKHSDKQFSVLSDYAGFVKPGGILVYSTCSLMPEENEMVMARFLEQNPDFEPDSLYDSLLTSGITLKGLETGSNHVTLKPSVHGCDGFFICRMRRL